MLFCFLQVVPGENVEDGDKRQTVLKSDGEDEGEISEEEETPAEEKKGTSIEILHMLCAINQISIVTCFSPLVHTSPW